VSYSNFVKPLTVAVGYVDGNSSTDMISDANNFKWSHEYHGDASTKLTKSILPKDEVLTAQEH